MRDREDRHFAQSRHFVAASIRRQIPRGRANRSQVIDVSGRTVAESIPLFESKFLASSEQTNGFANALLAGFRSLRYVDPDDEVTAVSGRQFLKELPGLGVLPEGFRNVARKFRNLRLGRVGIC